jgi:hypothetical protein
MCGRHHRRRAFVRCLPSSNVWFERSNENKQIELSSCVCPLGQQAGASMEAEADGGGSGFEHGEGA